MSSQVAKKQKYLLKDWTFPMDNRICHSINNEIYSKHVEASTHREYIESTHRSEALYNEQHSDSRYNEGFYQNRDYELTNSM